MRKDLDSSGGIRNIIVRQVNRVMVSLDPWDTERSDVYVSIGEPGHHQSNNLH
jgi:hypothetical protein